MIFFITSGDLATGIFSRDILYFVLYKVFIYFGILKPSYHILLPVLTRYVSFLTTSSRSIFGLPRDNFPAPGSFPACKSCTVCNGFLDYSPGVSCPSRNHLRLSPLLNYGVRFRDFYTSKRIPLPSPPGIFLSHAF